MPIYPTIETVREAKDANDHECLRVWNKELPAARNSKQVSIRQEIEDALAELGFPEEVEQPFL